MDRPSGIPHRSTLREQESAADTCRPGPVADSTSKMSNGSQRRTRSERVAALELPPGRWERVWLGLCHRDVLARMALAFAGRGGRVRHHSGMGPAAALAHGHGAQRDSSRRAWPSRRKNPKETAQKRRMARDTTKAIFLQDVKPLEQLRAELRNTVAELTKNGCPHRKQHSALEGIPTAAGEGRQGTDARGRSCRLPGVPQGAGRQREPRSAWTGRSPRLWPLWSNAACCPSLPRSCTVITRTTILAYTAENPIPREVEVSDVTIDPKAIQRTLSEGLGSKAVADRIYAWLEPQAAADLQAADVHARCQGK